MPIQFIITAHCGGLGLLLPTQRTHQLLLSHQEEGSLWGCISGRAWDGVCHSGSTCPTCAVMWCWWGGSLLSLPSHECAIIVPRKVYRQVYGPRASFQHPDPQRGGWSKSPQLTKGEQKRDPEHCPRGKLCVWLSAASRKAGCLIHLQSLVMKCFDKCDMCLWWLKKKVMFERGKRYQALSEMPKAVQAWKDGPQKCQSPWREK